MFKETKPFPLTLKDFSDNPYFQSLSMPQPVKLAESLNDIKPDDIELHPTKLRVSTMTAICTINLNVNLKVFFDKLDIRNIDLTQLQLDSHIVYPFIQCCQFGNDNIKGINHKKSVKKRNKTKTKKRNYFQNQMTLVIYLNKHRSINLKIFLNGKIQMTGMKAKEEGYMACQKIIDEIRKIESSNPEIIEATQEKTPDNPGTITDFDIVLINSDFYAGCKLKRDKLYEILTRSKYFVSYEPDIYPGVNAKFYWNKETRDSPDEGICKCQTPCDGKGLGNGCGDCKKITIATFQSGNIIITGARNQQQTLDAYQFINRVFKENYHTIVRYSNDNDKAPSKSIKMNIKTSDVINIQLREELINKN